MGLLSDLRDYLNTSNKITEEGFDIFKPISVERYKDNLSLEERALSDGAAGLPDKSDSNLSSTELAIANAIEDVKTDYLNQYHSNQRSYKDRIAGYVSNWTIDKVKNEERALVSHVIESAKLAVDSRFESERQMQAVSNEIVLFRRFHDLTQRTPDVKSIGRFVFAMVGLFAVEFIVSIALLRETGDLQAVIMWALIYSTCNSAIPYYFGITAVRWCYLKNNSLKRNAGFVSMAAAISLGIALNFFVGHYRAAGLKLKDLMLGGSSGEDLLAAYQKTTQIMAEAIDSFLTSPFAIDDGLAYIITVAGFIVFVATMREGVVRLDYYPGYGELLKRFSDARDTYDEEIQNLMDDLQAQREEGISKVNDLKDMMKVSLTSVPTIIGASSSLKIRAEDALNKLEGKYQELVQFYRETNRKAREGVAVPKYFNHLSSLEKTKLELPEFDSLEEETKEGLMERVESFADKLHEEFEKIIGELRSVDQILDESGYPFSVEISNG